MSVLEIKPNPVSDEQLKARMALVDSLENKTNSEIQWYQCTTPEDYRKMRREGTNGFPTPYRRPGTSNLQIQSRDSGRMIPLHVVPPASGPGKAIYLHFHAGGWVIGSALSHDKLLGEIADIHNLTCVSVEYRLAPENPYPAAQNDCVDAALYALSSKGEAALGGKLKVIGGESAGAYLTILSSIILRDEYKIDVRSKLDCLVPSYGLFDLTYLPSVLNHTRRAVMGGEDTKRYIEAEFRQIPATERKSGKISPLYADLGNLPPALFLIGTVDPLYDDSVFMAAKYALAGNKAELKVVPGAVHGFTLFDIGESAEEGLQEVHKFLNSYSA